MDVLFVIDATGSMSSAIRAATDRVTTIAAELRREHPDMDLKFGSVCYRDPVEVRSDKHEVYPFGDIDGLHQFLKGIRASGGGGDGGEDWVGAFKLAVELDWRNGTRTMIWIADDYAHGKRFCGRINHEDQTELLPPLVEKIAHMNIYFQGLDLGAERTFNEIKRIYEEAGGPKFSVSPFRETYSSRPVPQQVVVTTDVLGRDFSAADYPQDYSSDEGYDSDSESHDIPMRKHRPHVLDEESVSRAYTMVVDAPSSMESAIVKATMDICRSAAGRQ